MELEVGDVVLCTVEKIAGTVVFVKIQAEDGELEGSIIFSEIAPGRIRNIRDYVFPKKQIVCKVLRISQSGHIDLSLRRVTQKESKEVKERAKEEQSYNKILRSMFTERADEIIKKIKQESGVYDFFQEAKKDPKKLERVMGKEDVDKIMKILHSQKKKIGSVKKEIRLSGTNPHGLKDIKEIFEGINNAKIKYLSGGRYNLEISSSDLKTADGELKQILENVEKKAKSRHMEFSIKEK